MGKVSLRWALSLAVLPVLLVVIAYQFGLFDPLLRARFRQRAQQEGTEWANSWYGIHLMQYPTDLVLYQDLVNRIRPDVIIETGTAYGGNALYLATILEPANPRGRVITIDIDGSYWRETLAKLDVPGKKKLLDRIHFIEGGSTDAKVVAAVKKQVPEGARVLVILDSLHTEAHVLKELEAYAPFVSVDSYVIVNDTQLEGWYEAGRKAGPLSALRAYLATTDDFVIDKEMNRFLMSCAHDGFLKRVR